MPEIATKPPILDERTGADLELVQQILEVYREFELPGQMQALLSALVPSCSAQGGLALGPGEGRALVPLGGQGGATAAHLDAFHPIQPGMVAEWLKGTVQTYKGLGPFVGTAPNWPGQKPATSVVFPVNGTREKSVAALMLWFDGAAPDPAALERGSRLLELSTWAVDNALQVLSMRDLVIKDDTASCFNRRYFEERLPEELSRAGRYRTPVSLIFLDMDNLKQVNNEFGHSIGSKTLSELSVRIRSKIRKFDKLFRFGGDEFCIVLPETEWHGAMEVADRVRDAILGKKFLEDELGENALAMSASLGIASYPLHARTKRELVQRADRAMQKVKKRGKNAIGIAEIEGGDDDS